MYAQFEKYKYPLNLWLVLGLLLICLINCVHPKVRQPNGKQLETFQVQGTPALVARGEYLANHVAACMDCHSQRDWTRLTGPIVPGTLGAGGQEYGKNYGLPGRVYGRNLTPAALKDWTDHELLTAITAGVSKSGQPLFPLMPYANYHTMKQSDAVAIIAYLRTLPPVANEIPPNQISAPVRLGMRLMPHRATLLPDSAVSSGAAYGQYLTRLAGCADCHTQRILGKLVKKAPFAGGMAVQMFGGTLRSANITPDSATGIGRWTKAEFVGRFKAYEPTHFVAPEVGEGLNTIMPWTLYAGMTEADLGAIYDYLRTVKPVRKRVLVFQTKEKGNPITRENKSS